MNLPNCFRLYSGFAFGVSLDTLIKAISWQQKEISLYGKKILQPRLTSWMGSAAYTYSGIKHEPSSIPQVIEDLKAGVESMTSNSFNSLLANQYRDGSDSVAWHSDDEPELGTNPTIASLSFGATRNFSIRHIETGEKWSLALKHGDLLIMAGDSQACYQHAVPKTTKPVSARINLTFRTIK